MKTRNFFTNILALALAALPLAADAQTWTGGGPDVNIDDPTNWGGTNPAFDGSADVTFASGGSSATLDTSVSFDSLAFNAANNFTINGPGTLTNGVNGIQTAGSFTYTIAAGLEITANQIWPINSGSTLVISGPVDDGGAGYNLLKSLTGTLTLIGTNTYSGTTTINGGTFSFSSIGMVGGGGSALGAPTNVANGTINLGGSATVYYTGTGSTSDRVLNLTGNVTLRNSGAGTLNLSGGVTGSGTLAFNLGTAITETGTIATGGGSLTKTGSGVVTLHNATNSFGYIDIYQGAISVDSIADIGVPSSFGSGTHFALGQKTTLGTLQFTGPSGGECNRPMVITGTSSSGGGIIQNTVAGQTLTMSGLVDTASGSVAPLFELLGPGNITMNNAIQNTYGNLTLTITGGGTATLSGTNTYTGPTTVSAGTLLVNGSTSTNSVNVLAGATLGGTGSIGGAVVVAANGNLEPGGPGVVGTLTLSNKLTLNGNTISFALANTNAPGASYDQIAIASNLVLNGANHIQVSSYNGIISNGYYTLITCAATNGSGTLTFPNGSTTDGNFTITVSPTNVILFVSANTSDTFLKWKGNVSGKWDTVTPNWAFGVVPTTYTEGTNVVFDDTAVNFNVTSGSASPGSAAFENSANNYLVNASIGGPGTVSMLGSSTVMLLSSNSYSGGTALNAGTLAVSNNYALGAGPLTIGGSPTLAALANLTLSNDVTLNAVPLFSLGSKTLTLAGNITGGAIQAGPTLSSGGLTLLGTNFMAASSRAAQQFKITGGTLTLAEGSTTLSNVALYPTGGQIIVAGGTHYLVGSVPNFTGFNLAATLTITGGAVHSSWFSLGYGGAGTSATFNMNGGYFDTTTSPLGAGTLVFAYNTPVNDVTTLNLNAGTILTAGIEEIGSVAPAANNIINLNGGTLMAAADSTNFLSASGLGMTVNVRTNGAVFDTAGFNLTVTNALLDGGGGGLTKNGTGSLDLSGANTYTGNTTINGGTLEIEVASLATNSTVFIAGGAALQLDFATTNQITSLVLNGVPQAPGVYSSNNVPAITGPGSLLASTGPSGPTLTSVTPNPLPGSSYPVTLELNGSGFTGATGVLLTNLSTMTSASYIPAGNSDTSLSVNFTPGTVATTWSATVVNGTSSAPVGFRVTTPAAVSINKSALASAGAGKVVLSGTGGVGGNSYGVLSATNLNPPVAWTPVVTNVFDGSGNFSYTNAVTPGTPQLFLRLAQ